MSLHLRASHILKYERFQIIFVDSDISDSGSLTVLLWIIFAWYSTQEECLYHVKRYNDLMSMNVGWNTEKVLHFFFFHEVGTAFRFTVCSFCYWERKYFISWQRTAAFNGSDQAIVEQHIAKGSGVQSGGSRDLSTLKSVWGYIFWKLTAMIGLVLVTREAQRWGWLIVSITVYIFCLF